MFLSPSIFFLHLPFIRVFFAADGNCSYHALVVVLNYIQRTYKKTVREVRRDIWEFTMNRKYYLEQKIDLGRIFKENLKYTEYVGERH